MKIYDISLPLSSAMPVWPGDPSILIEQVESMEKGADYNLTRVAASVHSGTHVDAPRHFICNGIPVDQLSLDVLTGPCAVAQLPDSAPAITVETLESLFLPEGTIRLLFRTRNSLLWARGESRFQEDFVAITESGARWLVDRGVLLVGIDYLSVAPFLDSTPTHQVLLGAGVIVIEGLDLSSVPQGVYDLYCLPLKLRDAEGAPARAILIQK